MKPGLALVTGGAGFIGSQIVDALILRGWKVMVVDNLSTGRKQFVNRKASFWKIDVAHPKVVRWISRAKPDVIFHYAAQISVAASVHDPVKDAETNLHSSIRLLDAASRAKTKRFIFAGTGGALCSEQGPLPAKEHEICDPISPYAIAKLAAEDYGSFYRRQHGLPFVTVRYANVYGPRQNSRGEAGVIAIFAKQMLRNESVRINGSGRQTRDFLFVDDAVRAALLMIDYPKLAGPYHVGTSIETSVNTLFGRMAKLTGYRKKPSHGPEDQSAPIRSSLDSSLITHDTYWHPETSLAAGLKRTIAWFREHPEFMK